MKICPKKSTLKLRGQKNNLIQPINIQGSKHAKKNKDGSEIRCLQKAKHLKNLTYTL